MALRYGKLATQSLPSLFSGALTMNEWKLAFSGMQLIITVITSPRDHTAVSVGVLECEFRELII